MFKAVVGTVEELAGSGATLNLVHDQFETNFFGPANIIKSTLPEFREQGAGHLLVLTGISRLLQLANHTDFDRRILTCG